MDLDGFAWILTVTWIYMELFGISAIWVGMEMEATEIVTGVVGSVFGFLGGVSLKILEQE